MASIPVTNTERHRFGKPDPRLYFIGARHPITPHPQELKFRYTNWRGEEHTYVVRLESLEIGPYGDAGRRENNEPTWVLHGHVLYRDGEWRGGRRTFILDKIKTEDVEVLS